MKGLPLLLLRLFDGHEFLCPCLYLSILPLSAPLHLQVVIYAGHKGFVRLALEEGAWLVPVLALGETLQVGWQPAPACMVLLRGPVRA